MYGPRHHRAMRDSLSETDYLGMHLPEQEAQHLHAQQQRKQTKRRQQASWSSWWSTRDVPAISLVAAVVIVTLISSAAIWGLAPTDHHRSRHSTFMYNVAAGGDRRFKTDITPAQLYDQTYVLDHSITQLQEQFELDDIDASATPLVLSTSKKQLLRDLLNEISIEKNLRKDCQHDLSLVKQDYQYYKQIVESDEASHLPHADPGETRFYWYIGGSLGLVTLGAIMSGLQVGLFSIDPMKLALLKMDSESDPIEQQRAETLTPLLQRHHWLLVSLLIANAAAMEALPIFLDALVPSYVAIILSVSLVLVFGEIIPQALCTKAPLAIGAAFSPLVKLLMVITVPISWPISKLLDYMLGEEGGNYFLLRRGELNALVDLHADTMGGHLQLDQINLMKSALAYGDQPVKDIMTPLKEVYMLEAHRRLDAETMSEIFNSGFSRIPCYDRNRPSDDNIVGLLIVKDLILLDPADESPVHTILNLYPRPLECVFPTTTLKEILNLFKSGKTHMAIVHEVEGGVTDEEVQEITSDGETDGDKPKSKHPATQHSDEHRIEIEGTASDPNYVNVGIVTLEDVIEAIIGAEIEDETDVEETSGQSSRLTLAKFLRNKQHDVLSPQEASAIYYNLVGNVNAFKAGQRVLSDNGIKRLIAESELLTVNVNDDNHHNANHDSPSNGHSDAKNDDVDHGGRVLYKRGQTSDYMSVILDGFVEIRAGEEGYVSEARRWYVLGQSSLKVTDEELAEGANFSDLQPHVCDFDAIVVSNTRILRMPRLKYINEIRRERNLPALHDPNDKTADAEDSKEEQKTDSTDGKAKKNVKKTARSTADNDATAVVKSGLAHHNKQTGENGQTLAPPHHHPAIVGPNRGPSPQPVGSSDSNVPTAGKNPVTNPQHRRATTAAAFDSTRAPGGPAKPPTAPQPPNSTRNRPPAASNASNHTASPYGSPKSAHFTGSYQNDGYSPVEIKRSVSSDKLQQNKTGFANLITDLKRQRSTAAPSSANK